MGAVETKLLGKCRRRIGDNTSTNYTYEDSELWLWLRDACEAVAVDLTDVWTLTAITADADFTVVATITDTIGILVVSKMIEFITEYEWKRSKRDGVGVIIKGGMDTIDTKKMLQDYQDAYNAAVAQYQDDLDVYFETQAMWTAKDLYTTSGSNTLTVN